MSERDHIDKMQGWWQGGILHNPWGGIICAQSGTNYSTDLTHLPFDGWQEATERFDTMTKHKNRLKNESRQKENFMKMQQNLEGNLSCADSVLHRVIEHGSTFRIWSIHSWLDS